MQGFDSLKRCRLPWLTAEVKLANRKAFGDSARLHLRVRQGNATVFCVQRIDSISKSLSSEFLYKAECLEEIIVVGWDQQTVLRTERSVWQRVDLARANRKHIDNIESRLSQDCQLVRADWRVETCQHFARVRDGPGNGRCFRITEAGTGGIDVRCVSATRQAGL